MCCYKWSVYAIKCLDMCGTNYLEEYLQIMLELSFKRVNVGILTGFHLRPMGENLGVDRDIEVALCLTNFT